MRTAVTGDPAAWLSRRLTEAFLPSSAVEPIDNCYSQIDTTVYTHYILIN
jgi:hypothetical protein